MKRSLPVPPSPSPPLLMNEDNSDAEIMMDIDYGDDLSAKTLPPQISASLARQSLPSAPSSAPVAYVPIVKDDEEEEPFIQWVDYLPHDLVTDGKRVSLDQATMNQTLTTTTDWEDSVSLDDKEPLVPHGMLVAQDVLQAHELLLDEPFMVTIQPDLMQRRRTLKESMRKTSTSREVLRHVTQRANLVKVLADIEKSTKVIQDGILAADNENAEQKTEDDDSSMDDEQEVELAQTVDDDVLVFDVHDLLLDPMV